MTHYYWTTYKSACNYQLLEQMNELQIRKATPEDLTSLSELFDGYRVYYGRPSDREAARQFLSARMAGEESVIMVAMHNQDLAGFVQFYPLFSSVRMQRLWLLNDLFVQERFRGRGISVALIESGKTLCRETLACGFMLETAKTNTIGNNLYRKAGLTLDTEHYVYQWETDRC
ncbi:MAG TPA: GNAT family N-acetyltransferase [Ohtaekwangia sp.]|nr:GNAT family N-acetyltransferase [Ohtaekwangia sp.]